MRIGRPEKPVEGCDEKEGEHETESSSPTPENTPGSCPATSKPSCNASTPRKTRRPTVKLRKKLIQLFPSRRKNGNHKIPKATGRIPT